MPALSAQAVICSVLRGCIVCRHRPRLPPMVTVAATAPEMRGCERTQAETGRGSRQRRLSVATGAGHRWRRKGSRCW